MLKVVQGRPPTSWIKVQLTEYYGQRYIRSRSWTVRDILWPAMIEKIVCMLGIRRPGMSIQDQRESNQDV